jgi:galactose mutarotase-like enzyme
MPWTGLADFTSTELDLHLTDLVSTTAKLHVPGRLPRQHSFSGLCSCVVLWTVSLKDFVCVEPWSGPADALNTGVGLITIPPGESRRGEFVIAV